MRVSLPSITIVLLVFSFGACAYAQTSALNTFTLSLSLGSRDTQVITLQQALNRDSATRIASIGPGSPGNETNYFGSLTKSAVIRFQEKYANEVLVPAGLVQGSGYVGFYTRTKLNGLSESKVSARGVSPLDVPPATTPSSSTSIVTPPTIPQNPNLKNFDKFLTALDNAAIKQGIPAATLATMKEQAVKVIATTTDLRTNFLKIVQDRSTQIVQDTSLIGRTLAMVERTFNKVFIPNRAHAAAGVPFGGALLFALPCNGGVWNITLSPLPPTFVTLVSYMSGSQAFLSYNIPATSWLLGEYTPGAGACWIGPYYIYSEGLITPMVGSSPI